MAITWGNIITGSKDTRKGKIGIEATINTSKSTNTTTYVTVSVYFASMYSVTDTSNTYYYDAGKTSATTSKGSVSINHSVASGSGWSSSNQTKIGSYEHSYTRTTSAQTKYFAAKITGIDNFGASNVSSVYTSVSIPALASYTVSYNANGGSGVPSNQTKWYGTTLTLSATKPTRTGYSFSKWNTAANGSGTSYNSGASYTANAAVTLYAQWTANTYTVTFNANGGTGAPANQTKTYGVNLTLSSTIPTRTNYNFLGWATTSNATTAEYSAGGTYTTNAAVTLYAVWEVAYIRPRITNFTVDRCDQNGTPSDIGTYALVKFDWECDLEVYNVRIEWKVSSASSYSGDNGINIPSSGTNGSVSEIIGDGALSAEYTYNIRVGVADDIGSNNDVKNINPMVLPIDVLRGGTGVSIGKPSTSANKLDVAWDTNIDGSLYANGNIHFNTNNTFMYGKAADNKSVALLGISGSNTLSFGWGCYTNKIGVTDIAGYDILHYVSNTASGADYYRPYFRKGDSFNVNIFVGGWVTTSNTQVCFLVPLAKPVIGNPTVTASTLNGLIIRQNGSYTHGSAASTYAKPTSYSCSLNGNYGVLVTATFSTTTNSINNEAAGIQWYGTLTFS